MPGKPEAPQALPDSAGKAAPAEKAAVGQGSFHAAPHVRALSSGAARVALILVFLLLGFLGLRYSRGGAAVPGEQAPPSYSTPGVDPDQLERMSERLLRNRWQEEAIEPPPPPPPPPVHETAPPPRSPRREKAIFEVPMAPQTGGRSNRLQARQHLEGGDGAGRPPGFPLPLGEGDRGSALTQTAAEASIRTGFQADGGSPTVLTMRPKTRSGLHLRRGSFLPLVLTHAVNTDVPGLIRGHLARDIRDTTGRHLLFPQGTLVVGQQRNTLSTGDSRLLIDWTSLQFPDGRTIDLPQPQGTAATDGSLGATGKIDRHLGSRFGTALLLGALGATLQLSQPQSFQDSRATFGQGASERQITAGEVGARLNDLAERTLEERLNRPPTIKIPAGARLQLLLLNDLVFPSPQPLSGKSTPNPSFASPGETGGAPPPRVPRAGRGIPGEGAIVSERRAAGPGGASSSLRRREPTPGSTPLTAAPRNQ